ncbi:hypothetical protein JYU34_001276 [Plutella xylostella]|uniref:Atos-like conserved domain-containing protein n=1 Tax=Plutella xylostella TaxID=51655 RepID=A0ABQ7R6G2_PLUXY|nr:hypothetical protein JYU34_001276 [Plutella xylostella]
MHSSGSFGPAPAAGEPLLRQVARLIIRASRAPGKQVQLSQPRGSEPHVALDSHVQALWHDQIPICIEVLLAPDCPDCHSRLSSGAGDGSYERAPPERRGLLLERWTLSVIMKKAHDSPPPISSQWLLSAVRSQLHFSQLAAWTSRLTAEPELDHTERRRKLSREKCNFKKLESNCDEKDLPTPDDPAPRSLNIVYSIKIPGESYKMSDFTKQPADHTFPITDIGNNVYLKVYLESLPRIEGIPVVKCSCNVPKRRASKEMQNEDIANRMNDLTLGTPERMRDLNAINSNIGSTSNASRRLSIFGNMGPSEFFRSATPEKLDNDKTDMECKEKGLVDDRMHTPCSENGKHKCNCDDESDQNQKSSTSVNQETKKLDERRLKEIAKYKRRLRKESKLRKLRDSNSESTGNSEGDGVTKKSETHTSIPILQAARFDRFRAIGCYRNQTYLTLPASRIESKSPFVDNVNIQPTEYKKTNTIATQTDDLVCECGTAFVVKCDDCKRGMVRSEANYDLTAVDGPTEGQSKKHKCDNFSNNLMCDIKPSVVNSVKEFVSGIRKCPDDDEEKNIIKRPKLKRFFPLVDRIEKLVTDRFSQRDKEESKDMQELLLKNDDTVFADMSKKPPRQKYSSIGEDYVMVEKCDYGTFDKYDGDSPKESDQNGFEFPDPKSSQKQDSQVPSPTEMDRFRWRFDSAASMVFHTKTGLPLTSSPAPLKRGNNCFDYDDSINGISGIKSALFHPVSPASPCVSPASPRPAPPPRPRPAPGGDKVPRTPRLRVGPSAGLLGSFEESALKGRLEPVATVHGFTASLGASGAFCPAHRRLPVTVFFYAPGGTNAPYMGHINLGGHGYLVPSSGTVQVSLFNPHGTLVKMFVVLYSLAGMPPGATTFLRQRTLYLPAGAPEPRREDTHKYMRYLIHLRFMTSKSGKLYLHTDIRIIVSRKADMDTAAAHNAIFKPLPTNQKKEDDKPTNQEKAKDEVANRQPCRVFGGCSDFRDFELSYENSMSNGVSYELRSFTYGPENPKYSPR